MPATWPWLVTLPAAKNKRDGVRGGSLFAAISGASMRNGILASALTLLCAAGLALAEPPDAGSANPLPRLPLGLAAGEGDAPAVKPPQPHVKFSDSWPGPGLCNPCAPCSEPCCPPGRVWASAEYLLWWTKND